MNAAPDQLILTVRERERALLAEARKDPSERTASRALCTAREWGHIATLLEQRLYMKAYYAEMALEPRERLLLDPRLRVVLDKMWNQDGHALAPWQVYRAARLRELETDLKWLRAKTAEREAEFWALALDADAAARPAELPQ